MIRPVERKTIRFGEWVPVKRDNRIGYSYTLPKTGKLVRVGGDRWMRAKSRLAQSALWTGASEYHVHGGMGARRWHRVVTVTQQEAEQFLRDAAASTNIMRASLRRSLSARDRRQRLSGISTREEREVGMSTHVRHPLVTEHGLQDDCERCLEHAARPFDSLDNDTQMQLVRRTLRWMDDLPNSEPRSNAELLAMRVVEQAVRAARSIRRLGIEV